MTNWKWPLSRKILSLALLNLVLIAMVLAIFAQWQFGLSIESLLLGPGRDRIMAIANSVGRDLDSTPSPTRPELLADYSRRYGVDFFLVDPRGESLSGGSVELPAALTEHLERRPERRDGPPPEDERPEGPPGAGPRDPAFLTITRNPLAYWVGIRIPTNGPDGEKGFPAVLLLRANSIFNSNLFFDWRSLLWLMAALAAVALLCWWPFVHGVTKSIQQMDRATEAIAQGRFDSHVTQQRRDELGHLGEQINRMAGRLEGFVKHQKRFLGDIAHELCAPIARIQFALGILEQRTASGSPQQTHVEVLREEIQDMSGLVNELLMFSKAGMQPGETPLRPVELGPVVQRAVSHQMPGSGTIRVDVPSGLAVVAHEPYLLRAISNLLRNALRYAGEDGPIVVVARSEGNRVPVTVSDCGPGLPEQSFHQVFGAFYRPEAARSRDTGGAGLGLAIVKNCVEACGGTVACRNREPSGLEVTISLVRAEALLHPDINPGT
ncbi:MAG TPA: HAMP domain-containing sensor histidine kinase [Bryobacteraceae bacterium]|jgi:two-component system sensor histidine kinase CpxA